MKLIFKKNTEIKSEGKALTPYIETCKQVVEKNNYASPEASLCLPSDKTTLEVVEQMVKKKKTSNLKYIIVIGIGGSNLGTKAIYDALCGSLDQLTPSKYPKMLFLDSVDPKVNAAFLTFIDTHVKEEDEFMISIISKSGTNTEPLINAEILLGHIKNRFPHWQDRCITITNEGSPLAKESNRLTIDVLTMPKMVGGRYSVFSAVGLFPLMMAGISTSSLLKGAQEMRDLCLLSDSSENYAQSSSIFQYDYLKKGRAIHNSFFFHPELESLGKWYRQLMGESIGKDNKGITPIVSVGSVDHHSMVQLYWGGPTDKTTEIIYSQKSSECFIPQEPLFPSLTTTNGKSTSEIMSAIRKGTAIAYEKQGEPYFETIFEEINEYELGAYMQYKMMEIMYLANLMQINAFDQPQVELYKTETKKILSIK